MAPSVTDSDAVQLEKTRSVVSKLFTFPDTLWSKFENKQIERISKRAMRLPVKKLPAGKFRMADFDNGDLGLGSSGKYDKMTVATKDMVVSVQTTKAQEYATDSTEKALFKVTKQDVEDATEVFRTLIDSLLQTPGTGQIGVMSSGSAGLDWVLGGNFGSKLILEGQTVNAYDSTFATKRSGDAVVLGNDIETNTISVDAAPSGLTDTDLIVVEGLSGANPVALYGIPYFHSNATSGSVLGLDRATNPGIRTPAVNAGGSNLTPAHIRLALNKSRMRLGIDSKSSEFTAWMGLAQEASYEDIAQAQIQIIKTDNPNEGYDPFFAVKRMAGVNILSGLHADPTRIDFLRMGDWGRAEMKPIDYVKWGDLSTLPLVGASGGYKAGQIWYLGASIQFWNQNPRAGAYIYALGIPDGYS